MKTIAAPARGKVLARADARLHCPSVNAGKLLLWSTAMLLAAGKAHASDWTVLRQQGRDYVTFANVAQFYQFAEFTQVSRTVSLRNARRGIRAQAGTNELFINGVRFFTDFPILSNGEDAIISSMDVSKIIEPILRPNRIRDARKVVTVVLDPGHGGMDQGAANSWGTEKAFALDVALAAREQLIKAGYQVQMTRDHDVGLSLEDRVAFANEFPDAVFISIHFNTGSGGVGVESYALAPAGVASNAAAEDHPAAADIQWCAGNSQDSQNMALAAAVHAAVLARISVFDRGVHHARFHVLRNIKIPAVLLEGGFLSNPDEGPRIATPQYRHQMGLAIAQAVQNYDAAVNFRSSGATLAVAANNLPPHARSITEPLRNDDAHATAADRPSISINAGE